MSTKKYNYLIFIGRFSPFHVGHQEVIKKALELSDNVIFLIGSSFRPRTIKNPWTYEERKDMILNTLDYVEYEHHRVHFRPLCDFMYNDDAWIKQVQENVQDVTHESFNLSQYPNPKIGIIGHEKDHSSFYLNLFPQWERVNHTINELVHATDVRTILFERRNMSYLKGVLPAEVYFQINQKFQYTPEFQQLVVEYEFIKKYKQAWNHAPYDPTFVTADAIVVQSGHVLLVVRDAAPGENLKAFPGGFVNQKEYIECAALRELKEETKIDVPVKVLRGNIKQSHIFDHPQRSLRGRTITQAFFIELPPGPLPKVKGSDDARHAMWIPFSAVKSDELFEDHYDIFKFFVNV